MEIRLATKDDLEKLNKLFDDVINDMYKKGIKIWHKIYPYCEFEGDIQNKCLYLITENENIVATFCLFDTSSEEYKFEWEERKEKSLYLSRLAVNVHHRNKGYGRIALEYASNLAINRNAKYLRIFVAQENESAINFYIKNGFKKVIGQTSEFAELLSKEIIEFGYEKKLK